MAGWTVRLARPDDLEQTYHVFLRATNHLFAQRNLPLIPAHDSPPVRSIAFRRHALTHDAERFWVAEDGTGIIGFGIATLRDTFWYLAALHVLPEYQNVGIGRKLLQLCMSASYAASDHIRVVISDSLNPQSNALYARHGLYQWMPLLVLRGQIPREDGLGSTMQICTEESGSGSVGILDPIDRGTLGVVRRQDHAHWLAQPDQILLTFGQDGCTVGYAYVSPSGIGPAAVRDPQLLVPALEQGLQRLADLGVETTIVKVPAAARGALSYLLRRGFRYDQVLLIDASQPFGLLDRYLVSAGDALF